MSLSTYFGFHSVSEWLKSWVPGFGISSDMLGERRDRSL